jgi:DNA-binding XRE family transcriptional regulator
MNVSNAICREPYSSGPSPSLFGRPSGGSYKIAVAKIIRELKARHSLSNERLAEILGCAEQTIANADKDSPESNLNPITLLNIAYAFGEEAIAPVRQLYLCAPAEPKSILGELDRAEQSIRAARKAIEERDLC